MPGHAEYASALYRMNRAFNINETSLTFFRAMPGHAEYAFALCRMNRAFNINETSLTFFRAMPGDVFVILMSPQCHYTGI